MDELSDQKLKDYLDSVYIISHSFSTISAYRIAIVNQNKTGFRDYLQELHNIDELKFVEQIKQEKFDVYATLRDHVVFLDTKITNQSQLQQGLHRSKGI